MKFFHMIQVTSERDLSNEANLALKAELERYRDVTGSTVEALEREKAVKAQLENQNKAQVTYSSLHALPASHVSQMSPMARDAFICTCALVAALLMKKAAVCQPAATFCCVLLLCMAPQTSNLL